MRTCFTCTSKQRGPGQTHKTQSTTASAQRTQLVYASLNLDPGFFVIMGKRHTNLFKSIAPAMWTNVYGLVLASKNSKMTQKHKMVDGWFHCLSATVLMKLLNKFKTLLWSVRVANIVLLTNIASNIFTVYIEIEREQTEKHKVDRRSNRAWFERNTKKYKAIK